MAVFITNVCKFDGCGITFPSLSDLIIHIEDTHIDYDPKVVEQKEQAQPTSIPLSYVLRFISEDVRKESSLLPTANAGTGMEFKRKLAIKHHSYSISSSNRSNTPTCSEVDEDEMVVTESEDSNDSWTTEEFSSEFIMRYGSRHSGTGNNGTPGNEKPFACPVPGCKKRYKNVNGIKYHSKNGHKKDGKVRKGYKCHCGKSYKTAQGLKNHALATHNSTTESNVLTQLAATGGGILLPRSTSPSQSLGSLSPSSISNMSSSASSCHGSSNTNNNNILQHLTNSVGTTVTTTAICGNGNSSLANGNGTLNLQVNNSQSQPHLQQLAATLNTNNTNGNQHLQLPTQNGIVGSGTAVGTEFFYSTSTSYGQQHPQQQKFSISASSTATASVKATTATSIAASLTATINNNSNNDRTISSAPSVSSFTSLPPMARISPTFIEHKYSANTFKEKFLANLRQNSNSNSSINSNISNNHTNNCSPINKKQANNSTSISMENLMIAASSPSPIAGNNHIKEIAETNYFNSAAALNTTSTTTANSIMPAIVDKLSAVNPQMNVSNNSITTDNSNNRNIVELNSLQQKFNEHYKGSLISQILS